MWIVSKDGKVFCTTLVPYDPETVARMKRAGYKIAKIQRDDLRATKARKERLFE